MYLDPSQTFEDLIIRVAEALGIASYVNPDSPDDATDNRARVPVDRQRLDLCKRFINDALDKLAYATIPGSNPARAHLWNCLKRTLVISLAPAGDGALNIDGDAGRYKLPLGVQGQPTGRWTWGYSSGGYGGDLSETHQDNVRSRYISSPQGIATGWPQAICTRPCPSGGWEAYVWPRPDAAYSLSATFRLHHRRLVELSDRHVFGAAHDQNVVDIAIALYRSRANAEDAATHRITMMECVANSIALDNLNAPKALGVTPDLDQDGYVGSSCTSRDEVYMDGVRIL